MNTELDVPDNKGPEEVLPTEWEGKEVDKPKEEKSEIDWKVRMDQLRSEWDEDFYELFHFQLDIGSKKKQFIVRSLDQKDFEKIRDYMADELDDLRIEAKKKAEARAKKKGMDWEDKEVQAQLLGRYLPNMNDQQDIEKTAMCRQCILYPEGMLAQIDSERGVAPGIVDRCATIIMELSGYVEPEVGEGNIMPIEYADADLEPPTLEQ